MKVWRYVITVDKGAAPNFDAPMATLTICKPRIRRKAKAGDMVLAFNGYQLNRYEPHSVRWAGVVSEVIPLDHYWRDPRFRSKKPRTSNMPDNIYRPIGDGRFEQIKNPSHGPQSLGQDTGGVNALAFKKYWYFGDTVKVLPDKFGLRMTNARRTEPVSELANGLYAQLTRWLDSNCLKARTHQVETTRSSKSRC